jgi:hypothetical protein
MATTIVGMSSGPTGRSGGLDMMRELQAQIVTRRQLAAFGVEDVATYRKVKRGEWQRVLPGICALTRAPLSTEQRRIAATLYAGRRAQLTGLCALHWYGFRHAPTTAHMHVLVPHETRRRSTGFVIVQRTHELDPAPRQTPQYQIASATRAVIDACRASADLRTARAVMTEAVQRQFTGLAWLDDELRRAGRSRTAIARRVWQELLDGVRSSPEAELRELTESSAVLPRVRWNAPLVGPDGRPLPTPDGWIDETGIALEVDSREYHSEPDDWARTLRRHNVLTACGALVLHITPREIREEPARILRMIEQAHVARVAARVRIGVSIGAPS